MAVILEGTGILECDSTGSLFRSSNETPSINVNGTFIKASEATLYEGAERTDGTGILNVYGGYIDIKTLNAYGIYMDKMGGVINCNTLHFGKSAAAESKATLYGGVFYVDVLDSECEIDCVQGTVFRVNTISTRIYKINQQNDCIVMVGNANTDPNVYKGNAGTDVNGYYVYSNVVVDASVSEIPDDTNVNGVYYANKNTVRIGNNVRFIGAAYFAGSASLGWNNNSFTVAEGATVAGGGNLNMGEMGSVIISALSTMCFDKNSNLYNATVDGSVYGGLTNQGEIEFIDSNILSSGSVYSLGYSKFKDSNINGNVTVYGTTPNCAIYLEGNTNVNGKIYLYDSASNDRKKLMEIIGWTVNGNAELAGYMADCGELSDNSRVFDMAIGSKAFYTAADLGGEFKATVSANYKNCGKVVYIGNEYEERFDAAFDYYSWIDNGHGYITKSLQLSHDPADDQKVVLAYNSTHDIDLNDVKVTITKGAEDCTSRFDIKLSHYYADSYDNAIERSLGVEIGATKEYKLAAGDEYKVKVEYNGTTITEDIEVTGVRTVLNFAGSDVYFAYATWSYDGGEFTASDTDCAGNTWAWYANGNTQLGYPAKTLVLDGIDFASSGLNAIIVPKGTTIILKGENRLYATTSAILALGDLTIIGEDDGSLTAISNELAVSDSNGHNFDAVIKTYGNINDTYTLLIKDVKLNLTAKKAAEVGESNRNCVNCYGISSDKVIIENSDITAYAGHAGQDGLESAVIKASDNIIIRGNTKLDLTSEEYALLAGKIKSVQLSKLEGADVTLEDFNSSLKNNGNVYSTSISGTSVSLVTKPIEQLEEAKTADVLDPDYGVQTLELSELFSGGTGSYVFALADGETLPDWITLTPDGTLTIDTPNEKYAGGEYKLTVADADADLRSDPLEFTLTVGKVGRTVNLTVDYDNTLGTVAPETGKVLADEDTLVEIKAKDGAYIESVTLDGTPIELTELTATEKTSVGRITSGTYTIEKIDSDHTVNVTFKEIPTYKVSVTANNVGTVTVETEALTGKPNTYAEGTDVVISALAADGYRIKSVTLGGEAVTLTNGKYTIKGIAASCEFAVEFEKIPTYAVTVTCGEHGSYTMDYTGELTAVREGTAIKFTADPEKGYALKEALVNGVKAKVTSGSFTVIVTGANEVSLTFAKSGGSSGRPSSNSSSESSKTLPHIENNTNVNGWDSIADYIKSNSSSLNGKALGIALNDYATVPADVIEAAKGKNITLVLRIDSAKSLEIDASTIKTAAAMNVGVKTGGTLPENILAQIKGTALPLNADVNLCGDTALVINVGRENAGKAVTLMLIKDGRAVGVSAAKAAADGTVRVELPEGGSYAVAISGASQLLGDVDGDMSVTIKDALALLKYVMSVEKLEADAVERGDVRATGKPDISDARSILRYSFGLDKLV